MLAFRRARQFTCLRRFSTKDRDPNFIQLMPTYQKALEFAVER